MYFKPKMKLLLYGLQRSGTKYLEVLLKHQFHVQFMNNNKDRTSPLQKHFRLYDDKGLVPEPKYQNEIRVANFEELEDLININSNHFIIVIS